MGDSERGSSRNGERNRIVVGCSLIKVKAILTPVLSSGNNSALHFPNLQPIASDDPTLFTSRAKLM